jgi:hypothetical protein
MKTLKDFIKEEEDYKENKVRISDLIHLAEAIQGSLDEFYKETKNEIKFGGR